MKCDEIIMTSSELFPPAPQKTLYAIFQKAEMLAKKYTASLNVIFLMHRGLIKPQSVETNTPVKGSKSPCLHVIPMKQISNNFLTLSTSMSQIYSPKSLHYNERKDISYVFHMEVIYCAVNRPTHPT